MPLAFEKRIIAEVSGHLNGRVNAINVFHGVNLILYSVANINARPGFYKNAINIFCSENLTLFTVISIHSIRKSTKTGTSKQQDKR